MVNTDGPQKNHSTKTRLLHLLKQADGRISGSAISRDLGISRVAVWKAVQSLQERGVPIVTGKQGYLLKDSSFLDLENIPFPGDLYFYKSTGSTMDESRNLRKRGKQDFLIIADEQSRGVGRNHRQWNSPKGGIFMTLSRIISLPLVFCPMVSMEVLQRSVLYLRETHRVPVYIKWPNDLFLEGKKLGGLLTDLETSGDRTSRISLGLGLNVNNHGSEESISLKDYCGLDWDREKLISSLAEIQRKSLDLVARGCSSAWKQELLIRGKAELLHFNGESLIGSVEGVDTQGRLIFRYQDNLKTYSPGECEKLQITNK